MNGFSVREHETVPVGSLSADEKSLSETDVDALQTLGTRLGIQLVQYRQRNRVCFRQFVGLVRVGGRDIEVLPKIDAPGANPSDAGVRRNLLEMLMVAHDTQVHVPDVAQADFADATWLDVFIRVFCRSLTEQVRRGLIKRYRSVEEDLGVVRGRILINEQATRNLIHQERISCEFDELDEDHGLNQMFRTVLERMSRMARSAATQQLVRELLLAFEAVSLRSLTGRWWREVKLDRMTSRFKPSFTMARVFLEGLSPDVQGGARDSFSLLFDMNVLFEEYVGRILRSTLAQQHLKVQLQHARHHLMHPEDGKTNLFLLKPDIVVFDDIQVACIGDTKWKQLDPEDRRLGVAQGDIYQMLGYADRYGCGRVLMIYPYERTGVTNKLIRRFTYQGRDTSISVAQLCLADLKTVPLQLAELYAQAVTGVTGAAALISQSSISGTLQVDS